MIFVNYYELPLIIMNCRWSLANGLSFNHIKGFSRTSNKRIFLRALAKAPKYSKSKNRQLKQTATARKLVNNELRRVDLDILEKLCLALNCTPNDLLAWSPSQNQANPDVQALFKLKRSGEADLTKLLGSLPMEKFDEVAGIIQNLNTD